MPFFQDIGAGDESLRHPLWGAFAFVKDHLEQMIALNVAWACQLLPAIAALAFATLPTWLRVLMLCYSAIAFVIATGVLYAVMQALFEGESFSFSLIQTTLRRLARAALWKLVPLFGLLGLLLSLILMLAPTAYALFTTPLLLGLFILLSAANYWGPLFAEQPHTSALWLLQRSIVLFWNRPARTLQSGFVVLFLLVLGTLSVSGLFLIVPVLIVALQLRCYHRPASQ